MPILKVQTCINQGFLPNSLLCLSQANHKLTVPTVLILGCWLLHKRFELVGPSCLLYQKGASSRYSDARHSGLTQSLIPSSVYDHLPGSPHTLPDPSPLTTSEWSGCDASLTLTNPLCCCPISFPVPSEALTVCDLSDRSGRGGATTAAAVGGGIGKEAGQSPYERLMHSHHRPGNSWQQARGSCNLCRARERRCCGCFCCRCFSCWSCQYSFCSCRLCFRCHGRRRDQRHRE